MGPSTHDPSSKRAEHLIRPDREKLGTFSYWGQIIKEQTSSEEIKNKTLI